MILLADASVVIDLAYVRGLHLLTQIAPTEVLDVVLMECDDPRQPDIVDAVAAAGIQVVTTQQAWATPAQAYRSGALSFADRLNLHYAKAFERVLLATDSALRRHCAREGVEIHGTLWLVEEAFNHALVDRSDLCRWLEVWPTVGSRLPRDERRRLERLLGC